ncbi:MAG: glycosyltransferase family 2 protein [Bacteroidales bacterium]|nr:glycosyltransferase family 2 protein [Bacteroidales bacterium]
MDLSIIIVSYNVRAFIEQCLLSVYAAGKDLSFEVFVVDNASKDNTPQFLNERFPKEQYPNLHVVANTRNVGFGRANNYAVERSKGDYILFLNPDTLLTENTLRESVEFARQHPDLGALGTMMLHTNGRFAYESRRGLATPWTAFCKMSGLASLFPKSKVFGRYYMRYLDKNEASEIEIVSGAYMMIPRKALMEHGAFDEQFFMYGEDIDLSYRLLKAGLKNYYIPSPILHYKGESTHKSTYRYVHVFYGAMLIFFKKHYHHYALTISIPIKLAIFVKAMLALMWYQIGRFKKFILPNSREKVAPQVYIGRHGAEVKALAEQDGPSIVCVEADEKTFDFQKVKAVLPADCIHLIFDLTDFSRDFVLNFFKDSDHKLYIGTYSTETKTLISGNFTVTHRQKEQ